MHSNCAVLDSRKPSPASYLANRWHLSECEPGLFREHPLQLATVQDLASLSDRRGSGDTHLAAASSITSSGFLIAFAFLAFGGPLQQGSPSLDIQCLLPSCFDSFGRRERFCKNSSSRSYTCAATQFTVELACVSDPHASCLAPSPFPPLLAF